MRYAWASLRCLCDYIPSSTHPPIHTHTHAGNHGGFQDTMRVNADFAYRLPDGLDSADAAPLMCAGITVYAPLKRVIQLAGPGCRVAVLGIGGLGHLALQFAAHMGGDVSGARARACMHAMQP